MKPVIKSFLQLGCIITLSFLFLGCGVLKLMTVNSWTTLSQETIDKNVSVLYHPGLVEGMKLVHGYTVEFPAAYTADHLGTKTANTAAENGWADIVILVELLPAGGLRNPTYRIGYYSKVAEELGK